VPRSLRYVFGAKGGSKQMFALHVFDLLIQVEGQARDNIVSSNRNLPTLRFAKSGSAKDGTPHIVMR
jgi:hypothetical protein